MKSTSSILIISLCLLASTFADTFTNRTTGRKFNGYVVQKTKGGKTHVRQEHKSPQYLNLAEFSIERNHAGRKNQTVSFVIDGTVDLLSQTRIFETELLNAANQGPLFILIEIDVIDMPFGVAERIVTAIDQINNCQTIAYVSGSQFGGAFSAGATIALACDKIYMRQGTAIGASAGLAPVASPQVSQEQITAWQQFSIATAQRNGRPAMLVKAMFDKDLKIIEIDHEGEKFLIEQKNKKAKMKVVRTVSDKGMLLTLTADDAAMHGIADKVVDGIDTLYKNLKAAKAKKIRNNSMLKAKRQYEKASRSLDKILPSIGARAERIKVLLDEAAKLEADILNYGGKFYDKDRNRYRSPDEQSRYQLQKRMNDERKGIVNQALENLRRIGKDYRKAISLAEKNVDLQHQQPELQAGLDTAEATFDKLTAQIRRQEQGRDRNRDRRRGY